MNLVCPGEAWTRWADETRGHDGTVMKDSGGVAYRRHDGYGVGTEDSSGGVAYRRHDRGGVAYRHDGGVAYNTTRVAYVLQHGYGVQARHLRVAYSRHGEWRTAVFRCGNKALLL